MSVLGFFSAICLPCWNKGLRSAVYFVSATSCAIQKRVVTICTVALLLAPVTGYSIELTLDADVP